MTATNRMSPVHPGEVLREEIDERDLSANALAQALDIPANRITAILNGQRGVTADTAHRLSRHFGTTPEFWLNLQKTWELRRAEIEAEDGRRVKFVSGTGSLIGGRHKDKKERITEALSDLQLVHRRLWDAGHRAAGATRPAAGAGRSRSHVFGIPQEVGARGSRRENNPAVGRCGDGVLWNCGFSPCARSPGRAAGPSRPALGVGGGFMQVTKVDEPGPKPTCRFPVAPHDLEFVIEWPLPGTADWTVAPSEKEPWLLCRGPVVRHRLESNVELRRVARSAGRGL